MRRHPQWSDRYATGIDSIDCQHQHIFQYLHDIDQAIEQQDGDRVENVVIDLLDYAVSHNASEEQLMREAGYPHLDDHHAAHEAFRRRSEDYVRRLAGGDNRFHLARQMRNDLQLWLNGHILHEDMAYVPWLRRQQPEPGLVNRLVTRLFTRRPETDSQLD